MDLAPTWRFGSHRLDVGARRLTRDGAAIELQPRVFDLLCALVARWGRVIPRAELTAVVWPDVHVSDNVLDQALRKLRTALGDEHGVTAVARRGWRFEGPVWTEAAAELIGREVWLAAADGRVRSPGLVAWWGPAGVGKSALAAAVAVRSDAVRVNGDALDDWPARVALALDLPSADRVGRALESRGPTTLVLDGAPAGLHDEVARWSTGAPALTVLVFSRDPWPGADEIPRLADSDAARVLAPRAGPLADALAVHARGLPASVLALRGALDVVSAEDLLRRLDVGARVDILAELADADLRSRPDPARALLGALVAAGRPVDVHELDRALPGVDVVASLEALRPAGWIVARDGRFAAASAARSVDPTLLAAGRARWIAHLRERVRRVLPRAVRMEDDALAALQALRSDLVAQTSADADLAAGLAIGARYQGPWAVARAALEAAPRTPLVDALTAEYLVRTEPGPRGPNALRAAAETSDPAARALAWLFLARSGGGHEAAEHAITAAREAGAPGIEALAEDARGVALAASPELADAAFDRAVALASGPGLRRVRGAVLQNRAVVVGRRGAHDEAARWLTAAVTDLEAVSGAAGAATTRLNLGQALIAVGRPKEAWAQLSAALPLLAALGDEANEALALFAGGVVRLLSGDRVGAERMAAGLASRGRHPRRRADHALLDGLVALGRGQTDVAEAAFSVAAAICRASGDAPGAAEAERLARATSTGDLAGAEDEVRSELLSYVRVQRTFSAGGRGRR